MSQRLNTLRLAMWNLFQNCGFSMSGAVAFTFLLSLFPFCIFLGALAGTLGGRELAAFKVQKSRIDTLLAEAGGADANTPRLAMAKVENGSGLRPTLAANAGGGTRLR